MGTRRSKLILSCSLASFIIALAACSSSTSSNPSGGSASAASTGGGTANQCVSTAQQRVTAGSAPVSYPTPATLSSTGSLKGKLIFYLPVEQAASLYPVFQKGLDAAANQVGARLTTFDGQDSAATANQGVLEAINQHASVLVLLAVSPAEVSTPLKQALAQGMKVIDVLNGSFQDPLNGLYAHISPNLYALGNLLADEALASSGCQSKSALVLYQSAFVFASQVKTGVQQEFGSLCAACSLYLQDINAADIPSSTPQVVQTALVAHPQLKTIIAANDKTADYVAPAVKAVGRTGIDIFGVNGEAQNLTAIEQGQQTGDVAYANYEYMGWYSAYLAFRAMLNLPADATALPLQAITSANVSSVSAEETSTSFVPGFQKALGGS